MAPKDRMSITEVAKSIGVTPRTIMRWEKTGKIKRSSRDWRGWRFYLKEELEEIRKFYESTYQYEEPWKADAGLSKTTVVSILLLSLAVASSYIYGVGYAAAADANDNKPIVESKGSVDINLAKLPTVGTAPATLAEAVKYTLGPEDVIDIDVRRHPEFSGQYVITSEGKIEYKFVGDVIVAGLTKVQLQERLSQILSEYIVEPEVNVKIDAYLSKLFYVVGEVNNPGKFYMKGNTITAREALFQAGLPAVASSAIRKCRLVTPDEKGRRITKYVNAYELIYGGDLRQNVDMKPGDVLYVPATIITKILRVFSPVTSTVTQAASAAAPAAAVAAL